MKAARPASAAKVKPDAATLLPAPVKGEAAGVSGLTGATEKGVPVAVPAGGAGATEDGIGNGGTGAADEGAGEAGAGVFSTGVSVAGTAGAADEGTSTMTGGTSAALLMAGGAGTAALVWGAIGTGLVIVQGQSVVVRVVASVTV